MAWLLADADLAQSQNGFLDPDGLWHPYFSDLASPSWRERLMRPDRNSVSLTGTAHTAVAYRRLPHGWRTTPPGREPDHYMWQQFLAEPWVRAVTATRITALQFPSHLHGRSGLSPAERRVELEGWRASLGSEAGRARFEEAALRDVLATAAAEHMRLDALGEARASAEARLAAVESGRLDASLDWRPPKPASRRSPRQGPGDCGTDCGAAPCFAPSPARPRAELAEARPIGLSRARLAPNAGTP